MKKIKSIVQILGIFIGVSILLAQISKGASDLVTHQFRIDHYGYVIISIIFILMAFLTQVLSWYTLMGLKNIMSFRVSFVGYMLSFLPRYIPGSIWGYASRASWLKGEHGIDIRSSNFYSIIEIGISIISCLLAIAILMTIKSGFTGPQVISILLLLSLIGLFFLILNRKALIYAIHKYTGLMNPEILIYRIIASTSILCCIWVFYGLSLAFLAMSTNINVSFNFVLIVECIYSFCIAWLIGFIIIFVPSGLGIREYILSALLALNLFIPIGQANLLSIYSRFMIFLTEFFTILISLVFYIKGRFIHGKDPKSLF